MLLKPGYQLSAVFTAMNLSLGHRINLYEYSVEILLHETLRPLRSGPNVATCWERAFPFRGA